MKTTTYWLLLPILFLSCESTATKEETNNTTNTEQYDKPTAEASPKVSQQNNENSIVEQADIDKNAPKNDQITEVLNKLDSIYASVPYFTAMEEPRLFMVSNLKHRDETEHFSGQHKYGLVDDRLEKVLEIDFDKIYNPNLTIKDCMEVRKGRFVGLYNFVTGELMPPRFKYIVPSHATPSAVAYGYADWKWYEINNADLSSVNEVDFSPVNIFQSLSFDVRQIHGNLYVHNHQMYDIELGKGMVVTPTYLEHLEVLPEYIPKIMLSSQQNSVEMGTEEAKIKTEAKRSLSDRLIAFMVNVYEQGIEGRSYVSDRETLVIYNQEIDRLNSISLIEKSFLQQICDDESFKFIDNQLVELISGSGGHARMKEERRYDFGTYYKYYAISSNGEIVELNSNRYFDFTKFVEIDSSYFKGCFGLFAPSNDQNDYNAYVSQHLTIEDLDVMRNEIFAEYGYIFKSKKWQKYFSALPWYKPRYENVDDQLTEIDKANIKVILKAKEFMKGKESEIVGRTTSIFAVAG